jgi:lipopolysaccharide transport system ATP-binding protein
MSEIAIKIENLSKQYRLGNIGTGTLTRDFQRYWAKARGKEDPTLKIGLENKLNEQGGDYVYALKDINLEIKKGDIIGVIGKNGAGKSTLLKILSRVTTPTTGTIDLYGRVASLLEVGTGFHPDLTGRENIFLNGAIMGMTKQEIKAKFDEIVEFAGVGKYINTPVKRYSSGMYVRLAFAVAAHLDPEILIVDEVLAVGDVEFQKKALGKMQDVSREEGRTVLFVSHNMTAIENLCTKICFLKNGEINFLGDVKEGIRTYLNDTESNKPLLKQLNNNDVDVDFELINFIVTQDENDKNFVTNKEITININYKTKRNIIGLRVGFDVIDNLNGAIIFRSFHDDQNTENTETIIGEYSATSIIPANLLKGGTYNISLCIGIHNVRWIIFESIVKTINIYNIGGINKNYADNRPGSIMPIIKWQNKIKI